MSEKAGKKLAIIANPAAGRGRALALAQEARRSLWGWPLEFLVPSSAAELREVCRRLDPEEFEAAIVIGGDGTVHHAVRGLAESRVPLLPYPGGTANDLATELHIPTDWDHIQQLIDRRIRTTMDLIDVNGVPFSTVAGIGVGARLSESFNSRRTESALFQLLTRHLRSQVYTLLTAHTLFFAGDYAHSLSVKTDVFAEEVHTAALFVCNQPRLGGDFHVAPAIDNNDKRFSILIVPRIRSLRLLQGFVQLKRGKVGGDFITFSVDRATVRSLDGREVQVFGDGETLVTAATLEFKIRPEALTVYHERRSTKRPLKADRRGGGRRQEKKA